MGDNVCSGWVEMVKLSGVGDEAKKENKKLQVRRLFKQSTMDWGVRVEYVSQDDGSWCLTWAMWHDASCQWFCDHILRLYALEEKPRLPWMRDDVCVEAWCNKVKVRGLSLWWYNAAQVKAKLRLQKGVWVRLYWYRRNQTWSLIVLIIQYI